LKKAGVHHSFELRCANQRNRARKRIDRRKNAATCRRRPITSALQSKSARFLASTTQANIEGGESPIATPGAGLRRASRHRERGRAREGRVSRSARTGWPASEIIKPPPPPSGVSEHHFGGAFQSGPPNPWTTPRPQKRPPFRCMSAMGHSGHRPVDQRCPLYPRKRTCLASNSMFALCQ
jgi:hypothetical protein